MTMKTKSPAAVGWRQMTAVCGQRMSPVVKDLSTKNSRTITCCPMTCVATACSGDNVGEGVVRTCIIIIIIIINNNKNNIIIIVVIIVV